MESFKDWLFTELQADEILDLSEYDNPDEITLGTLYEDTELDEATYNTYKEQFIAYCERYHLPAAWDLDEV